MTGEFFMKKTFRQLTAVFMAFALGAGLLMPQAAANAYADQEAIQDEEIMPVSEVTGEEAQAQTEEPEQAEKPELDSTEQAEKPELDSIDQAEMVAEDEIVVDASGCEGIEDADEIAEEEEISAEAKTISGNGFYTLRFFDDEAHGGGQLFDPHTTDQTGVGFKTALPADSAAGKQANNIVRHGYKIKTWHLYHYEDGTKVDDGLFTDLPSYTYGMKIASTKATKYVYKIESDIDLVAVWDTVPYTYNIEYKNMTGTNCDFTDSDYLAENVKTEFDVETAVNLCIPYRQGYLFDGWYTDAAFTNRITQIPKGVVLDSDADGNVSPYVVYAKWRTPSTEKVKIASLRNTKKGVVNVSFAAVPDALTYEIAFSTNKSFKKAQTSSIITTKAGSISLTNLLKKTYYVRIRAYSADSLGIQTSGKWSDVKSIKVKKGVKEVKAKKGKIKLSKVEIKNGNFHLKAKAPSRLKSSDVKYYVVTVDPFTGKVAKKIRAVAKTKTIDLTLPVREGSDVSVTDLIQGKYAIAVKEGKKYKVVTNAAYISNPEGAAEYKGAFPTPVSKKGLQGHNNGNIKHIFVNVFLNEFFDVGKNPSSAYRYNGNIYYFNRASIRALAADAARYNKAGIVYSAQFMLKWPGSEYSYLVPKGARSTGHAYYTLNGKDKKARETWEALFSLMAEYMACEGAHIDNWILGNEVNVGNSAAGWYWRGSLSRSEFMANYASTYKALYYAVRSHSANSRVYICTDHTFNDRDGDWGAKPFMELFDKNIKAYNKKINWNLAYHAYPAILTSAATWNDAYTTNSLGSEFVTPKNLNILTDYVKKNYGKKTRIILSEQGFTAIGAGNSENVQAAGVAYLYYKAEFNDMIDAVIYRSLTDDAGEVAQGLAFGLSSRPTSWNVFVNMDTPQSTKYTNPLLPVIGAGSWSSIIKGWDESKFKNMK